MMTPDILMWFFVLCSAGLVAAVLIAAYGFLMRVVDEFQYRHLRIQLVELGDRLQEQFGEAHELRIDTVRQILLLQAKRYWMDKRWVSELEEKHRTKRPNA
jgi:hypothetical protein